MPNSHHSSNSVEHFTPTNIVEAARSLMGGIDLDPATTLKANAERIHAKRYYTKQDNGLDKKWHGRVFLNPPGGRIDERGKPVEHGGQSSAKVWWQKLVAEYTGGKVTQAIFIGFSIELLQTCQLGGSPPTDYPICIPKRRIAFDKSVGKKFVTGNQPTHANVIVYLPDLHPEAMTIAEMHGYTKRFQAWFGDLGAIMIPLVLS
jgi:hypothetical protein